MLHCGDEVLQGHLEPAVTDERNDLLVRPCELGAQSGRKAEAHGAESTGGDERARLAALVPLGHPHLVLADVGDDDSPPTGQTVEQIADVLMADAAIALPVAERITLPPLLNLLPPCLNLRRPHMRDEPGPHPLGVAHDREL